MARSARFRRTTTALEVLRVGARNGAASGVLRPAALAGERFGNALAEIGTEDFQRRTRLVPDGDGFRLIGNKFYCTGAVFAHRIPTLAVAQEDGREVTHIVIVPRDAAGITIVDDWDGFGQRVTGSGSVTFDNVRVEADWVLPFQASFETPTTIGPVAQLMHAAIDLGIGRGAFAATLPFIRDHARPWVDAKVARASDDPLTIHHVGDVKVEAPRRRGAGASGRAHRRCGAA